VTSDVVGDWILVAGLWEGKNSPPKPTFSHLTTDW